MMNRQKYLHELKEKIDFLPSGEKESALRYCEEYFDEAGEENFEQAMQDLGTPQQFARQTIQNSNSRQSAEEIMSLQEHRKNKSLYWRIPLIILALPLILILTPAIIIIVATILFVICLPVLILMFLLALFFSLTVVLLISALRFMFIELSSALLLLGGGLVCSSLFLVVLTGIVQLFKLGVPWFIAKVSNFFRYYKERRGSHSNEI